MVVILCIQLPKLITLYILNWWILICVNNNLNKQRGKSKKRNWTQYFRDTQSAQGLRPWGKHRDIFLLMITYKIMFYKKQMVIHRQDSPVFFKRFYLFIFRKRERGKERKRNIDVQKKVPRTRPQRGTRLISQAYVLTGN